MTNVDGVYCQPSLRFADLHSYCGGHDFLQKTPTPSMSTIGSLMSCARR